MENVLDLHTFRPQDVKDAVAEFLDYSQEHGILEVRIVHGKGRAVLLRTVHSLLSRTDSVKSYSLATPLYGGEGATIVHLRKRDEAG